MEKGSCNWITALCLSALLAVLILLAGQVPPMDDTYIHLVYGRSLLSASPLSFNPGEPSTGFTSPLWLIPSALASILGWVTAPSALMLASALAAAAAVLVSGTGSLILITGPLLFHGSSGMETGLACLFIALAWRSLRDPAVERWTPLILAGAFLTRPELLVLALPLLLRRLKKGPLKILALLLPAAAAAVLWVAWNLHSTGMPLPGTFYAKQSLPWIEMLRIGGPQLLRNMLLASPLLIPAALLAVISLAAKRRIEWMIPLLLGAAAISTQPNSWFQMRYWVPFLFACGLVVSKWLESPGKYRKLTRILLVISLVPGLLIFGGRRLTASSDVRVIDYDPAKLLLRISEPGEVVAAADIGAVGWFTDLYVLDLDGLISPEMLPGSFDSPEEEWQHIEERADYLLAFPVQYARLTEAAGTSLESVETFVSPDNVICGEQSVVLWKINR
jgi:hypothetical protein